MLRFRMILRSTQRPSRSEAFMNALVAAVPDHANDGQLSHKPGFRV